MVLVLARRALLTAAACLAAAPPTLLSSPRAAVAAGAAAGAPDSKLRNLPADQLADIVARDIRTNQFLVTGALSRDIYAESCTFKDEIDTYTLDKWIKGTGALFDGAKSHVDLVGAVQADDREVRFRFDEILCFNLPLIKPKVPLTGTLILTRSPEDGLIERYQEIWDTGVVETLSKAYL